MGYDNSKESELLFRARSNTLGLNDFNRHKGGVTRCELCDADWEDIEHFMLECPKLSVCRDNALIREIGGPGTNRERLGKLLFCNNRIEDVKALLGKLWRERTFILIRNQRNRNGIVDRAGPVVLARPRGRRTRGGRVR